MEKNIEKSTDLFTYPSFLKGVARIGSIYGSLDEYNYKSDPDTEAIKKDWSIIGKDIGNSIQNYGKKKSKNSKLSNSCTAS